MASLAVTILKKSMKYCASFIQGKAQQLLPQGSSSDQWLCCSVAQKKEDSLLFFPMEADKLKIDLNLAHKESEYNSKGHKVTEHLSSDSYAIILVLYSSDNNQCIFCNNPIRKESMLSCKFCQILF